MNDFEDYAQRYLGTTNVDEVRDALWGDEGLELISKMSPDPSSISTPGGAPTFNRPGRFSKPISSPSRSSKTKLTMPTAKTRGTFRPTGQKVAPIAKPKRAPRSSSPSTNSSTVKRTKPTVATSPDISKNALTAATGAGRAVKNYVFSSGYGDRLRATGKKIHAKHGPVKPWESVAAKTSVAGASAGAGFVGYRKGKEGIQNWRHNNDLYAPQNVPDRLKNKPVSVDKSAGIEFECEFSKVAEDKHQVFGWASIMNRDGKPVVDRQGDWIAVEEIEKSAYDYVVKSRTGGNEHRRSEDREVPFQVSDMIESFVVTPEKREAMSLGDDVPDGWWVGFKVNDEDTWDDVKSGKVTGFSVHGKGKRQAVAPGVT